MQRREETVPSRAWKDAKKWILDHIVAWFLAFLLPGGGAMLAAWLVPDNASVTTAAFYGFIGGLAGLLLLFTIDYMLHLIITPYRQRNEARAEVIQHKLEYDELKRSIEEQKQSAFYFEFNDHSITTTDGGLLLGVTFYSDVDVIVDNLQLELNGKQFQPFDWTPFKFKRIHSKNYIFDLTGIKSVSSIGHQDAKFTVAVDNINHESRPFNIYKLL